MQVSPDIFPTDIEEPQEKFNLQEATEFISSYITPQRPTKSHLVNVSPKRILKKAKMEDEEKKDN